MTERELFDHAAVEAELRDALDLAGSQKQLAADIGVSVQFVNDMVKGRKAITGRVLEHLGFERIVLFRALSPSLEEKP